MAEEMLGGDAAGSVGIVQREYYTFGSANEPFVLEGGGTLEEVVTCYEVYGTLNSSGDNAILIAHGLTGSSHAAGRFKPDSPYAGYWDRIIGKGRPLDTDRWCIIAPNALGGCRGSTGPASPDPRTGKPYGSRFPTITIRDMVRAQRPLLDHLGVRRLRLVIGASMGGMQAFEWAVTYPDIVDAICPIGSSPIQSAQALAFNHCMRRAIMADPEWRNGDYYDGPGPRAGLAVARMIGHITYLCDDVMERKFGLRTSTPISEPEPSDWTRFAMEEYLDEEGRLLVHRFDANAYMAVSRAIDLHDIGRERGGLAAAYRRIRARCLLIGISSDILFPPESVRGVGEAMQAAGADATYWEMESNYGHDAFLEEQTKLGPPLLQLLSEIETPLAAAR